MASQVDPVAEPRVSRSADRDDLLRGSRRSAWSNGLDRRVARLFFGTGALSALLGVPLLLALPLPSPGAMRWVVAGTATLIALVFGLAWWRLPRLDLARTVMGCGWLASIAVTVIAFGLGEGLRAVGLAYLALLLACVVVVNGWRPGVWLAAGQVGLLGMLLLAETSGVIPGRHAVPLSPAWVQATTHVMLLGAGLATGALLATVVRSALAQGQQREHRFRALLQMAADWYWEMDTEFRYTALTENRDGAACLPVGSRLGVTPWTVEQFGLGDEQMDAHRADLEAHRPFNALLVRRRDRHGRLRILSISGQPRFDAAGRFTGYWGVGRDVTREATAQRAREASEARYRELFARSPTALLLHRQGTIIEANAAAARMFGFGSGEAMLGLRLVDWLVPPEGRDFVERRIAEVERLPAGQALPMTEYELLTQRGELITVEASAVRVETPHGLATLSIFHDVSERLAAQSALRRSETLLSLLVATSPDSITLTELTTGRYLMVNDTFLRLTGWSRDEVIGRTSVEIGLWTPQTRTSIVQALRERGRIADWPLQVSTKAGESRPLMVSAARFSLDGEDYLVTNSRDMTESERGRLEREAILDNASVGIALTRERVVQMANRRLEQMLGYGRDEMVGRVTSFAWPSQAEFDAVAAYALPLLAQGETVEIEHLLLRRDATTFWCRMLARSIDVADPHQGTIWIFEDITERRAVQAALAKARDDAQAANRAKSAFLANMSHEIRTPLNGMIGLTRLALESAAGERQRAQYLHQIHDSALGLLAIISDILDLSKIEAGKLLLEQAEFDLHELATSVQASFAPQASTRGLRLALAIAPGVPRRVRGDAVRLRQILANFTSNAIKFTAQGHVHLEIAPRVTADGSRRMRFGVIDTGPGIPPDAQARLFQPFSQADESTTRRFGGTGLGLSICRQLAELMGGQVGLDSEVGRGSHFWADIPLEAAPMRDKADAGAGPEALPDDTLPTDARVLLVEDNPVNMLVANALLEQWGLKVTQATDGAQAVEAVMSADREARPFDLVLMDVQMPVMSGHEATRALRARFDAQRLPIIALTAAALVSEREEALAAGMNDFLTKPIDPQRLRRALARHLPHERAGNPVG
jgi:PAS domain S-box-containing protein